MKKFNEYKERVFKIRIVGAPAGAWYEDLIGTDIETNGYNQYDKENEWRVNVAGEEKLIDHNNARVILKGGFARWSTVLVSGKRWGDKKDKVATLCGENLWGNLQVNYISGGQGVCNPEDIAQVLDEGNCFDESSAYVVAKFYEQWKSKQYLVCPDCKSSFEFYSFSDHKTLKCRACMDEEKGERGIRLDERIFKNEWIQLTEEMIDKHNSEVLYKYFKEAFTRNSGDLDPDHKGYISDSAPEDLMEVGAKIKDHYDLLGDDRVKELRSLFKACYKNALILLKKKAERIKEMKARIDAERRVSK